MDGAEVSFSFFFYSRIKFQNNPAKSHSSPHLLPHCSAVWGAFCVLFLYLMFCGWFSLLLKGFFHLRESQLVFRTSYESVNMNVCVWERVFVYVLFSWQPRIAWLMMHGAVSFVLFLFCGWRRERSLCSVLTHVIIWLDVLHQSGAACCVFGDFQTYWCFLNRFFIWIMFHNWLTSLHLSP